MIEVGVATMGLSFAAVAHWAGEHDVRWLEVMVGPVFNRSGEPPGPEALDLDDVTRHGPGRVQEVLDRHGVRISALAPMLNLLDPDPTVREYRAAVLRQTIDACVRLGVGTVVIYGGSSSGMFLYGLPSVGPHHPSNMVNTNIQLFQEVMTPLAAYAESQGVRIALETAPRGGGHGNVAHNPELWDRIFNAVPSPALGLSFDPSHLVWLQIGPVADVVRRYGSRIYHVDGKDTEILRDRLFMQGVLGNNWWRYRIPGMGELDWRALISALFDVGYDGPIDIENEDPIFPGLPGCAMATRYLTSILPPRSGTEGANLQ
jgi:sugar phosphate isomerase/epimerase